jgi:hypothetical protein
VWFSVRLVNATATAILDDTGESSLRPKQASACRDPLKSREWQLPYNTNILNAIAKVRGLGRPWSPQLR